MIIVCDHHGLRPSLLNHFNSSMTRQCKQLEKMAGLNVHDDTRRTVVRHGENRDLSDGPTATFDPAGTFVDGCQVSVHVTGEATSSGNLLASC